MTTLDDFNGDSVLNKAIMVKRKELIRFIERKKVLPIDE